MSEDRIVLTEKGRQRLMEIREATITAACTAMADWIDLCHPANGAGASPISGADAREVLEVAAELLRYPVTVGT